MHLAAVHPRSAAAAIGDVTYGLLPVAGPADEAEEPGACGIAHDFLDRVGDRLPPIAAVGPVAPDLSGVAQSRASRGPRPAGAARRASDRPDRPARRAAGRGADPRAARPRRRPGRPAHRRRSPGWSTTTGGTTAAWSRPCGPGSTPSATSVAAADSVFVHQNTFRYRLRRVAEVGEIDLLDPDQRFAAMLQLRVLRLDPPRPVPPDASCSRHDVRLEDPLCWSLGI